MKSVRTGRRQYGALPFRVLGDGSVQVLLITSRDTGRWVIPKGWPMRRRTPEQAAAIEAYEEAGIKGHFVLGDRIGSYRYRKMLPSCLEAELKVGVFLMAVDEELEDWPERTQRRRDWFDPQEAAALVAEPALARMIRRSRRLVRPPKRAAGAPAQGG